MILALLLPLQATAEQEYFTWIDAQGRIHNTPKPANSDQATTDPDAQKPVKSAPENSTTDYLTEDEFAAEQERQRQERPPFFTWIDAEGRLRNETVPQVDVVVSDSAEMNVTDHTLLPPLRVSDAVRDSGCCGRYRGYFRELLQPYKPVLFSRPELAMPLATKAGDRPAWYWQVPAWPVSDDHPVLQLRLRGEQVPMALIALDEQWLPLHFIPRLVVQSRDATWKSVAYEETLISVADPAVRAFILYFPQSVGGKATLEVEWRP